MTQGTASTIAPRKRPPKALYTYIFNPAFRLILRSPLHTLMSRNLMLLTYTGPKSGKRYTLPVGYVQEGNNVLVATDSGWGRTMRGGTPVELQLRGDRRCGTAELITDEAGMRDAFKTMLARSPFVGEIVGLTAQADGTPRSEELARARQRGFMVVRITLTP